MSVHEVCVSSCCQLNLCFNDARKIYPNNMRLCMLCWHGLQRVGKKSQITGAVSSRWYHAIHTQKPTSDIVHLEHITLLFYN